MTEPEDTVPVGSQPGAAPGQHGPRRSRPPRRMSGREAATVIVVMALFVGTGVGVILRSAEAASVAFGLGLVAAAIFGYIAARGATGSKEEQ